MTDQDKMAMVDVVEALIRHRRGLAEIEAKLDAFEIKGRDVDSRLDRVERLLLLMQANLPKK